MRAATLSTLVLTLAACPGTAPGTDAGAPCPTPEASTLLAPDAAVLTVQGDTGSTEGIFDPALVSAQDAGWLSYSSVASTGDIHTRLARSDDRGATWRLVTDLNASGPLTVTSKDTAQCPQQTCTGTSIHEVSSLVFDADDPAPARRWKLFTHRYLVKPDRTLLYHYGHIALSTAPAPEGPWTAPVNAIGWPSDTPFSSADAGTLATSLPGLGDCLFFTEPGALFRPGAGLELALGCVALVGGKGRIRVELLHSADHAATFTRVGTLVSPDDLACGPGPAPNVNAAALFQARGKTYLSVSPEREGKGYQGCVVFEVADLQTAALRRDDAGVPVRLRAMAMSDGRFSGACTFAEGLGGFLLPHAQFQAGRQFSIARTGVEAP